MSTKNVKILPLNRVEGDLEIHLELEDHIVSEVRSVGTMYRGFENLLIGRAPLDGLVITPRICGICSTAHLKAAAKALDMVFEADVPDDARRVRNITHSMMRRFDGTVHSRGRQPFIRFARPRNCWKS